MEYFHQRVSTIFLVILWNNLETLDDRKENTEENILTRENFLSLVFKFKFVVLFKTNDKKKGREKVGQMEFLQLVSIISEQTPRNFNPVQRKPLCPPRERRACSTGGSSARTRF